MGGDLKVHRLGFGAMRITGPGIWGEPGNPQEARRVLRRAVEIGVNLIDTADSYGPEVSERLIAEALHPYPSGLVIATKGGLTRQGPNQWAPVGRAEYLRQCVEMSLRRLRVERIDLYQLHRFDPKVPAEETLGALKELQLAGKIHHVGLSKQYVAFRSVGVAGPSAAQSCARRATRPPRRPRSRPRRFARAARARHADHHHGRIQAAREERAQGHVRHETHA